MRDENFKPAPKDFTSMRKMWQIFGRLLLYRSYLSLHLSPRTKQKKIYFNCFFFFFEEEEISIVPPKIVDPLAKIRRIELLRIFTRIPYTNTCVYIYIYILRFACVLRTKLEGRLELKTNPILASVWRGDTMLNNYSSPPSMCFHARWKTIPTPPLRLCARTRFAAKEEGCEYYSRDRANIYYQKFTFISCDILYSQFLSRLSCCLSFSSFFFFFPRYISVTVQV